IDKELTICADDYINTFKVEKHTAYGSLKNAVMGLFEAKWGYQYINEKVILLFVMKNLLNQHNMLGMKDLYDLLLQLQSFLNHSFFNGDRKTVYRVRN
ncbi:TPA: hypothetical protein ACLA1M_002151, partial [Neisseria meningitidis]